MRRADGKMLYHGRCGPGRGWHVMTPRAAGSSDGTRRSTIAATSITSCRY